MIGGVHTLHPLSEDEFYLRILQHHDHCKGTTSFEDLLTVNNIIHESYKVVCRTLGLLLDEEKLNTVLQEACLSKISSRLGHCL